MSRMPQLRIAVTSPCGKACIYCRPGGEGTVSPKSKELTREELVYLTTLIVQQGVTDVKLTGGDPMLRKDIVEVVRDVKRIPGVRSLHLVTRHHLTGDLASDLCTAGLDVLNFSIDSLDRATWESITQVSGHNELIDAVYRAACAHPHIKINMVVMKGINSHEIPRMVDFAGELKAELKLLDLIPDIAGFPGIVPGDDFGHQYYFPLEETVAVLREDALSEMLAYQPGGLGHPMRQFKMPNGATVTVKSVRSGAWYGDVCKTCTFFPCHDAIMALRLTAEGQLQRCLLREDNLINLGDALRSGATTEELAQMIATALRTFTEAEFYSFEQREALFKQASLEFLPMVDGVN